MKIGVVGCSVTHSLCFSQTLALLYSMANLTNVHVISDRLLDQLPTTTDRHQRLDIVLKVVDITCRYVSPCGQVKHTGVQNARTFSPKKGMFLYSAVSSPLDRSKRFTLFLPWQTCSFRHQLGFSGNHSSHAAITRNDYSLTFPPLSTARYSSIHHGENAYAQTSKDFHIHTLSTHTHTSRPHLVGIQCTCIPVCGA